MHYYGTEGTEHKITGIQYLTDNRGQAFREQVLAYMEQVNGIGIVREFTGLTSEWEEQEIQGQEMEEIQTESMVRLKISTVFWKVRRNNRQPRQYRRRNIRSSRRHVRKSVFLSGKDKAVWDRVCGPA